MIGGAKGIGIGIDFGIPNQYCRATSKPYIEKDVLDSLRVVASAYGKSNDDADRSIVKNLVDASNPFIISNAAFKLNSGFGEYKEDFTTWSKVAGTSIITDSKYVLTDEKAITNAGYFLWNRLAKDSFKVKISNIPNGGWMSYRYRITKEDTKFSSLFIREDGIYTLPATVAGSDVDFFISTASAPAKDWVGLTITQIPSFEGAFFTDGVEDLITSTKTVQEMGITDEVTVVSMIHQIDKPSNFITTNNIRTSGSVVGRNVISLTDKTGIYGWYKDNIQGSTINVINNILGDKADYTASASSNTNLSSKFSVVGCISNDSIVETSQVAWYWTIIANKVLTTDQINQVIAYFNLDRTLNPDILCNTIKQGITNENHAEFGDKLIDFSGNGRDIQLNNIAWKGDSGIGKYEVDFASLNYNNTTSVFTATYKSCSISKIIKDDAGNIFYNWGQTLAAINSTKIQVIGLDEIGAILEFTYLDESGNSTTKQYSTDGIYDLPASAAYQGDSHNTNFRFSIRGYIGDCDITITQIPSHAGALLLDGINDFGKVTGMPIYKDYTVVADYERLKVNIGVDSDSPILSKAESTALGAFMFNTISIDGNKVSYSFGRRNIINADDTIRKIFYQSKYINDGQDININSTFVDSDKLWLGTYRDSDSRFIAAAIYSLMSFPYSMSEFLIERQLKKHKLGTLYPDMVEFRPVIKSNASYDSIVFYYKNEKVENGTYLTVGSSIGMHIRLSSSPVNEIKSITVNGIPATFKYHDANNNIYQYDFNLTSKSPQKINITIDEYIRFEDIVQPYPVLLRFKDENGNEVSWGGKFRVGSTITRIGSFYENNLIDGLYIVRNPKLNGNNLITPTHVVEKSMVFTCDTEYLLDNNEPKCILSPSRLRIPNSSYKLLGYIPDISGHGNHGVIHNSAYAEGSGVNEDGSYQFDGVDDFVTIPTTVGGKQMLMKVNWQKDPILLYDQRASGSFAVLTTLEDDAVNSRIAYQARNPNGKTYIDGIENNYIETYTLKDITHNITIVNSSLGGVIVPVIGCNTGKTSNFAKMSLYDFMLFDEISTDDKILELNEYVGIQGNVWRILTQLSNSTLISNEILIKNE
jgi:hypothetical protein